MINYKYNIYDEQGNSKTGIISASDEIHAANELLSKGFHINRLYPVKNKYIKSNRISSKYLILFTWQLSAMLDAGANLLESIKIIEKQVKNKDFKNIIHKIKENIQNGFSLSESLQKSPETFSKTYINVVRAGEKGGILNKTLKKQAEYLEQRQLIISKLKSSLTYPIILSTISLIAIIFLISFVIPKFFAVFQSLTGEIPLLTNIVFKVSVFIKFYALPFLLLFGLISVISIIILIATKKKIIIDNILIKIPFLGNLIVKFNIANLAGTLNLLLECGVPIIDALKLSKDTIKNSILINSIDSTIKNINKGQTFFESFSNTKFYPEIFLFLVSIGERTGNLDKIFKKISEYFTREVEFSTREFIAILEPAFLVVIGSIVCIVAVAVFIPITDLINIIR